MLNTKNEIGLSLLSRRINYPGSDNLQFYCRCVKKGKSYYTFITNGTNYDILKCATDRIVETNETFLLFDTRRAKPLTVKKNCWSYHFRVISEEQYPTLDTLADAYIDKTRQEEIACRQNCVNTKSLLFVLSLITFTGYFCYSMR